MLVTTRDFAKKNMKDFRNINATMFNLLLLLQTLVYATTSVPETISTSLSGCDFDVVEVICEVSQIEIVVNSCVGKLKKVSF